MVQSNLELRVVGVAVLVCPAILCSMGNKSTEKVYEVSFHLMPTMDADGVLKAFEQVKKVVSDNGKVLSEEQPVLRDLAYMIRHTVRRRDGSYDRYTEAYFGSVKFSSSRDGVKHVEQALSDDDTVLRFLILETSAEDTRIGEVLPGDEKEEKKENKGAIVDTPEGTSSSDTDGQDGGESGIAEQSDEEDAK